MGLVVDEILNRGVPSHRGAVDRHYAGGGDMHHVAPGYRSHDARCLSLLHRALDDGVDLSEHDVVEPIATLHGISVQPLATKLGSTLKY